MLIKLQIYDFVEFLVDARRFFETKIEIENLTLKNKDLKNVLKHFFVLKKFRTKENLYSNALFK